MPRVDIVKIEEHYLKIEDHGIFLFDPLQKTFVADSARLEAVLSKVGLNLKICAGASARDLVSYLTEAVDALSRGLFMEVLESSIRYRMPVDHGHLRFEMIRSAIGRARKIKETERESEESREKFWSTMLRVLDALRVVNEEILPLNSEEGHRVKREIEAVMEMEYLK